MTDPAAKVRAAEAIRLARGGLSLSRAARQAATTVATVRRYFGPAVRRRKGRLRVAAVDNVPFTMRVAGIDGIVQVEVTGSKDRSTIGAHHNAIDRFLGTGDTEPLAEFEGVEIGGVELETDPDRLVTTWRAGIYDDLDLYNHDQQATR